MSVKSKINDSEEESVDLSSKSEGNEKEEELVPVAIKPEESGVVTPMIEQG